jgi:hypothetical protein
MIAGRAPDAPLPTGRYTCRRARWFGVTAGVRGKRPSGPDPTRSYAAQRDEAVVAERRVEKVRDLFAAVEGARIVRERL